MYFTLSTYTSGIVDGRGQRVLNFELTCTVVSESVRMQVSTANNVKVYNLSAGKSLPEWISDRKKRTLLKNDVG